MNSQVAIPRDEMATLCKRWQVTELALFVSVRRADFGPESDVDMLVEFAPGYTPGLEFVSMAEELSEMFGGKLDVLKRSSAEQSRNYIRRKAILASVGFPLGDTG